MILKTCCIWILGVLFAKTGCSEVHQISEAENELELKVYHYKVPCVGESAQLCLKIEKANGETEFFYDAIEGFNYEWGYNYTIRIAKKERQHVPADASAITYTLKKILKKEKVTPEQTFELPLQIDEHHFVEKRNGVCRFFEKIEIQTGAFSCQNLAEAQSAVFRHSADTPGLVLVSIK